MVDALGHPLHPESTTLSHKMWQDIVHEIFHLAHGKLVVIGLLTFSDLKLSNLVHMTKKPGISAPWLLLTESPEECLDMDCLPTRFVVTNASKSTKKVLNRLWDH